MIVQFKINDILKMKKKHPCSSDTFKVLKCGTDVKIECTNCKRELIIPREKLEKTIKCVITAENGDT